MSLTKPKKRKRARKWGEIGKILSTARTAAKLSQKTVRRYMMAAAKYPTEISERTLREYESGRVLAEADRLVCLVNLYATSNLPPLPVKEEEDERVPVCADPVMAPSTHADHQRVVDLLLEVAVALVSRGGDLSRAARKRRDGQVLVEQYYRQQGLMSFEDVRFQDRPWTKAPPPAPPRRD